MKKGMICLAVALSACLLFASCEKSDGGLGNVVLGTYKGVEVTKPSIDVTEEEISAQIQSDLQRQATEEDVTDRAVENGDKVNIDYVGTKDGVAFDGGTDAGFDLTIGSNSFIDGFETGLIGAKLGEQKTLDLTFPTPYQNKELEGAAVQFAVTINSIKKVTTPELTDEVAQKISTDVKTVDEYKTKVKTDLEKLKTDALEDNIKTLAWEQVLKEFEVEKYEDGAVDKSVKEMTAYYTGVAEENGLSFADYLEQAMGATEDSFKTMATEAAQAQLKEELAAKAIAEKEKIKVSDEEYKTALEEFVKTSGAPSAEEFEKQYGKEMIETTVLGQKVIEFVAENATVK